MNDHARPNARRGVSLGLIVASLVGLQLLVVAVFAFALHPGLL